MNTLTLKGFCKDAILKELVVWCTVWDGVSCTSIATIQLMTAMKFSAIYHNCVNWEWDFINLSVIAAAPGEPIVSCTQWCYNSGEPIVSCTQWCSNSGEPIVSCTQWCSHSPRRWWGCHLSDEGQSSVHVFWIVYDLVRIINWNAGQRLIQYRIMFRLPI